MTTHSPTSLGHSDSDSSDGDGYANYDIHKLLPSRDSHSEHAPVEYESPVNENTSASSSSHTRFSKQHRNNIQNTPKMKRPDALPQDPFSYERLCSLSVQFDYFFLWMDTLCIFYGHSLHFVRVSSWPSFNTVYSTPSIFKILPNNNSCFCGGFDYLYVACEDTIYSIDVVFLADHVLKQKAAQRTRKQSLFSTSPRQDHWSTNPRKLPFFIRKTHLPFFVSSIDFAPGCNDGLHVSFLNGTIYTLDAITLDISDIIVDHSPHPQSLNDSHTENDPKFDVESSISIELTAPSKTKDLDSDINESLISISLNHDDELFLRFGSHVMNLEEETSKVHPHHQLKLPNLIIRDSDLNSPRNTNITGHIGHGQGFVIQQARTLSSSFSPINTKTCIFDTFLTTFSSSSPDLFLFSIPDSSFLRFPFATSCYSYSLLGGKVSLLLAIPSKGIYSITRSSLPSLNEFPSLKPLCTFKSIPEQISQREKHSNIENGTTPEDTETRETESGQNNHHLQMSTYDFLIIVGSCSQGQMDFFLPSGKSLVDTRGFQPKLTTESRKAKISRLKSSLSPSKKKLRKKTKLFPFKLGSNDSNSLGFETLSDDDDEHHDDEHHHDQPAELEPETNTSLMLRCICPLVGPLFMVRYFSNFTRKKSFFTSLAILIVFWTIFIILVSGKYWIPLVLYLAVVGIISWKVSISAREFRKKQQANIVYHHRKQRDEERRRIRKERIKAAHNRHLQEANTNL